MANNTVAVVNSNEDVVESIQLALDMEGYTAVSAHVPAIKRGQQDFVKFIEENDPQVVIYDISPPYKENWTFFHLIQHVKEMKGRKVILTTTNEKGLREFAGKTDAFEILGKPFEYHEIVELVKKNFK